MGALSLNVNDVQAACVRYHWKRRLPGVHLIHGCATIPTMRELRGIQVSRTSALVVLTLHPVFAPSHLFEHSKIRASELDGQV
jgi:hypothetical protein